MHLLIVVLLWMHASSMRPFLNGLRTRMQIPLRSVPNIGSHHPLVRPAIPGMPSTRSFFTRGVPPVVPIHFTSLAGSEQAGRVDSSLTLGEIVGALSNKLNYYKIFPKNYVDAKLELRHVDRGDSISLILSGNSDIRLAEVLAIPGHEGRTLYVKFFTRVLVDLHNDPFFFFRVESTAPWDFQRLRPSVETQQQSKKGPTAERDAALRFLQTINSVMKIKEKQEAAARAARKRPAETVETTPAPHSGKNKKRNIKKKKGD